jgi:tetratricopeptide (TPR) repeat protein
MFLQLKLKYPDNESLNNYLGLISLREQNFYEAQNYFTKSILHDSLYYAGYINLALVSSKLHQNKIAEKHYLKAIKIIPTNPKAYLNLGILYNRIENWNAGIEVLKKSIELSSGDLKSKSHCYFGIALLNKEDTITALDNFNLAIEYKPDYILPRIQIALLSRGDEKKENELLKILRLNPKSFQANYYLGELYANNKNYSKAEFHLRKALEKNIDDENSLELLSSVLISQERFQEAELIAKGFSVYDTLPQSYFQQARIASKRGEINNAITLYLLALEKSDGDYPEALLNLAILYKQNDNIQEAINAYQQAIKIKNNYATAYFNLAYLYSEREEQEKAIFNYKKAIEFDSKSGKSWYNLSIIYEKKKEFELAIECLNNAIKADPTYLKALSSLGVLYAKLGNYEQAIETYKTLIFHYPNYSRGYYNLGLAYSKLDLYAEAIESYSKVIEIDPENIKAKTNIGVLYARIDNIDLAIKTFEDAIDMEVTNHELRYNLALQYEKANRLTDAIYQFSKAIQLKKDYIKAYDKLIDLYNLTNDKTNANIIHYKKLKLRPNNKDLYAIGKKLYEDGEYRYALEALEAVLAENYKLNWTNYWIGMIYMDTNEIDKSISYFEKTQNIDSNHKFAFYRLGQCFEINGQVNQANVYFNKLLDLDPDFKIVHKKKSKIQIN